MQIKKYLYLSILMVLIFIAIVGYYIISPVYIGMFPFGIMTGIILLIQIALLILSIKNLLKRGLQWRIIFSIGIEIVSILLMGYFFLVWSMFI